MQNGPRLMFFGRRKWLAHYNIPCVESCLTQTKVDIWISKIANEVYHLIFIKLQFVINITDNMYQLLMWYLCI
jgi:hypothetical protein